MVDKNAILYIFTLSINLTRKTFVPGKKLPSSFHTPWMNY